MLIFTCNEQMRFLESGPTESYKCYQIMIIIGRNSTIFYQSSYWLDHCSELRFDFELKSKPWRYWPKKCQGWLLSRWIGFETKKTKMLFYLKAFFFISYRTENFDMSTYSFFFRGMKSFWIFDSFLNKKWSKNLTLCFNFVALEGIFTGEG